MGRPKGLTPKMKKFCYAYAKCSNATEAYLEAYDTTNRAIAGVEGSKLLQRDDITAFLREIDKPIVNKITNERERKRKILWDGITRCIDKGDESGAARYMDILNKMDSEYVNINRNIDDSVEKLSGLSTEQLMEIANASTADNAEPTEQ